MSSPPEPVEQRPVEQRPIEQRDVHEDAVWAFKYLALKAAIFMLVPLVAALVAVWWRFG